VDLGHLAESLIYYDRVLFNLSNQPQFARVLSWFIDQGRWDTFLALVSEGTLGFYEYSFMSAPVRDPLQDRFTLLNIQDQEQAVPNSFEKRFLYHRDVEAVVPKGRQREKLYRAFRDHVIEVKASDFSQPLKEAEKDFADPERTALVVQAFVDEIFRIRQLGRPPKVECTIVANSDGSHTATVNVDFRILADLAGPQLNWAVATPIHGSVAACRFLQSASMIGCDFFLAQPMGRLVGDKLYESARAVNKPGEIIETLKYQVEFPDVRALVNDGRLDINALLELRAKAMRFRRWLQDESARDRDALIAYHWEVAKEAGLSSVGRRALNMFGFIGAPVAGAVLGEAVGGPPGAMVGAAAGGAISWLVDLGSKVGGEWRPVVFGNWYRERITELDLGRRK
jgi:hypothetical protein